MDSTILGTIKTLLGLDADDTAFDGELMVHINTALMAMKQLNVGPPGGFTVMSGDETWLDFLGSDTLLQAVKTCVYLKVRIIFDPPANSFVLDAFNKQIDQWEFRISVEADPYVAPGVTVTP